MPDSLAAVFDGVADQLELRRLPLPTLQPSEVLVRVLGCTLCGSDLHSVEGRQRGAGTDRPRPRDCR